MMRDRDVRCELHRVLKLEHGDDKNTRILDELGLCHGAFRVDIAVVNGSIHGYEIKSDSDTLDRLAGQVISYCAVLDFATLVVGEKLYRKARLKIPRWWGLTIADDRGGQTELEVEREALPNPSIDPISLAQLLWRSEAIEVLAAMNVPAKMLRCPRATLYEEIVARLDTDALGERVRNYLKLRTRWRGQQRLSSRVDLLRPKPTC